MTEAIEVSTAHWARNERTKWHHFEDCMTAIADCGCQMPQADEVTRFYPVKTRRNQVCPRCRKKVKGA